jgi:hypothetical protein
MPKVSCGFLGAAPAQVLLAYHGPVIKVDVGFDKAYKSPGKPPRHFRQGLEALVDSGARESCIDSTLANELGLPTFDRQYVSGVSGRIEVDYLLAQIHIASLAFVLKGRFAGVPMISSGMTHPIVLGRSFLSYMRMNYDGPTGDVELIRDP